MPARFCQPGSPGPRLFAERAIVLTDTALAIVTNQGDRYRQTALLSNLGDLYQATGQTVKVRDFVRQSILIYP